MMDGALDTMRQLGSKKRVVAEAEAQLARARRR